MAKTEPFAPFAGSRCPLGHELWGTVYVVGVCFVAEVPLARSSVLLTSHMLMRLCPSWGCCVG